MGVIKKRFLSDGKTERWDVRIHRRKSTGTKDGALSQTFDSEKAAKAWMNKTEAHIDSGGKVTKAAEVLTFADAAATYIAQARPSRKKSAEEKAEVDPKSAVSKGEIQIIATLVNDWGAFRISDITNTRIQGWIDRFLKTPVAQQARGKIHPYFDGGLDKDGKRKLYSPGTVRHHFFNLKKVLRWTAVKNDFHLDANLFVMLEIPGAWEGKRERRLEDGEEEKLRAAFKRGYVKRKEWDLLLTFSLETAARMQEILKAEWKDVNYRTMGWNIPKENVKTSLFRNVPMSDVAISCLREMEAFKDPANPRIFHQWADSSTLSKAWRRVVKRSGIDDLHFHDLRHEGVVRFFENTDLTDTEIMSITGHTSHEMLKSYSKHRMNKLAAPFSFHP